jgi:uncharacterized Zn-finger protein
VAVQLNFYPFTCCWTHRHARTQRHMHLLFLSLLLLSVAPHTATHLTSRCTGASSSFLFRLGFIMLFPLTFQSTLNEIQPVHGEEWQYSCDVCNKSSGYLRCLKIHQCTHSGEPPFCCCTCNKSFGHLSSLKVQECIHTGEWPSSCDVCNKSFIQKNNTKSHLHIHVDVCSKS